ncbi:glycine-rich protein 2-like [Musa acuminata AAA Group]|uniref:glycine-rich protein 2-like n=1 Tax=Musa acuminata AAA Group TaxID=214697 RepID=UPI0031E1A61B
MEEGKRWWGTVTWIEDDGSGFITPVDPGSGRGYLFDQSSFGGEDVHALHIGEFVEFSVEEGNDGNPKAVNITSVDPGSGGDNLFDQSSFGGEDVPALHIDEVIEFSVEEGRATMASPTPSTSPAPAATLSGAADAGEAGKCVVSAVRGGT